jgi:Bacterial PH domain
MVAETMRWYRSKVDWWMWPVLCLPPVALLGICFTMILTGQLSALAWFTPSIVIVFGVYFGLVIPLRYGLDETCLLVRFGICRQRIPLVDIVEVQPTHNPIGSPALSLDRLRVQYGQGFFKFVLISPADRNHFLDDLAQKAGLKREGERLVRS